MKEKRRSPKLTASLAETETYCRNQQAQKDKMKTKRQQSRTLQQVEDVMPIEPALPLVTPPRQGQEHEHSSDGSAYDTSRTFKQRCRQRLRAQKKRMKQNMVANAARKSEAGVGTAQTVTPYATEAVGKDIKVGNLVTTESYKTACA